VRRSTRLPSPYAVGDRVRHRLDGPGLLAARRGVVVAVLDQWPTLGPDRAYQAIEVAFDHDPAHRLQRAIGAWLGFVRDA
jgi:hypothetical protein